MNSLLRWAAVLPAGGLLRGCDPCFECGSDLECTAGKVCRRVPPSGDDDGSQCVVPCSAFTSISAECDCPDSPRGSALHRRRLVSDQRELLLGALGEAAWLT